MTAPVPGMTGLEIRASVSLASIFALRLLGLFLILPVFAVYAQSIPGGTDATLVGLALGIYGLTQGLLQIPYGAASDRWGRKPVIAAGLVVFAAGSFIAAAATDIAWTIAGRAIQGAGAISAAVTAMIADSTRDEHRTKAMALVGASVALTFAGSLVLAPMLYPIIGVRGLFAMTGVLVVAAIGVLIWVVPATPASAVAQQDSEPRTAAVLFDRQLLRLNIGIFVLHTVLMAMFVVIPLLLVEGGLPLEQHWKIYLPVVMLSFALMAKPLIVAERRALMRPLFIGSIVLVLAAQLGLLLGGDTLLWMALWLLIFFTGFNILEASLPSLVSRLAPASAKGLALGIYNTAQALGLFAGGALGGVIVARWGSGAVFVLAAIVTAGWWLIALGMREVPVTTASEPVPN
ncbi:MAG: MFS transporter [Pseudomonadota bacterium]|nr:MFS transporter [Pseudomonadota bacterium]